MAGFKNPKEAFRKFVCKTAIFKKNIKKICHKIILKIAFYFVDESS